MMKITLGNLSRKISAVGLGCWQFSGGKELMGRYWEGLTQDLVNDIVRASIEEGVDWFDSAEAYGAGHTYLVNVLTEPRGLDLYIDGEYHGRTNRTVRLPQGTHVLILRSSGVILHEDKVSVPNQSTVYIDLENE